MTNQSTISTGGGRMIKRALTTLARKAITAGSGMACGFVKTAANSSFVRALANPRHQMDRLLEVLNALPETKEEAYAMGQRAAMAGAHVKNNPYCHPRFTGLTYKERNFSEWCSGIGSDDLKPCLQYNRRWSDKDILARAYYLGFGSIVWKAMGFVGRIPWDKR